VKRFFATFVALVFALQSSWAAVGSMCNHGDALTGAVSAHNTHVSESCHVETAEALKADSETVIYHHCGSCHLIHIFDIPAERAPINAFVSSQGMPIVSLSAHASWVQPAPDRPNWLF